MHGRGHLGRGGRPVRALVGALALVAALTVPATAATPAPDAGLVASLEHVGVVDLGFFGPPDVPVTFSERVGAADRPLASAVAGPTGFAPLLRAVSWRCDRRSRSFGARFATRDGSVRDARFEVRTPSCIDRAAVRVPAHVGRGRLAAIRLTDRWRLGDRRVRLCVGGAGLRHRCELLRLPAGASGVVRRVRPPADGRVRVVVALDRHRTEGVVGVGRAAPVPDTSAPVVLATGDSTIEGIDSYLGERLGTRARTVSASRPGTGLSKTALPPSWPQAAAAQVTRLRPRVTVISLGANDGFAMQTDAGTEVVCCDEPWVAEYAARARGLMQTYTRAGGRLVWLELPAPRDERKAAVIARVNEAVRRAAETRSNVRVLDLGALISPGGRYAETVRVRGRDVDVRAEDGLHLSNAGASIAADAVLDLLANTRWLRG